MPIYEYVCRGCGAELEKLQRFSDAPLTDCPECGEAGLTKKVSAAGFRLKGGGWYVTDFRDGQQKKSQENKTHGEKVSDSNGKDEKKTSKDTTSSGSKSAGSSEASRKQTGQSAGVSQ
jgi:putative FmdB family regulatory protein